MKILYSICGIGLGHVMRSNEIIKELRKKHDVIVAVGGNAYNFMRENTDNEHLIEIDSIQLFSGKQSYDFFKTFYKNIVKIPRMARRNYKLFDVHAKDVDIIITDHEITSLLWGKQKGKKVIFLSHVNGIFYFHLIEFAFNPLKIVYTLPLDFVPTTMTNMADTVVNTHFLVPERKRFQNTYFFGPLIAADVIKKKTLARKKEKIVVYLPENKVRETIQELEKISKLKNKRIIFFTNKRIKDYSNIEFKQINRASFINELTESLCLISHGGLSSIFEALYLKKPVLVITDKSFYERYFNGTAIEMLGYGKLIEKPEKRKMLEFFNNLPSYESNFMVKSVRPANKKIIKFIENEIKRLASKKTFREKIKETIKTKIKMKKIKEIARRLSGKKFNNKKKFIFE